MESKLLPSVSIIIPVYGVESYIRKCIESVCCQNYAGPLECIIVDDCGPDNSIKIAKQIISSYKGPIEFKIIYHEHNKGLSGARNTGMQEAKGEYIYFLDSDDELTFNCFQLFSHPLSINNYDVIVGGIKAIGKIKKKPYLSLVTGAIKGREAIYTAKIRGEWYQMAQNKLYRREFLKKHSLSFREGIIHEDELWSAELTCVLNNMYAVNDYTYLYYVRDGSIMTTTKLTKRLESFVGILNGFNEFIVSHRLTKDAIANDLYFKQFIYAIYLVWRNNKEDYFNYYVKFRAQKKIPILDTIISNGINFKRHIRDIHYIFPKKIGAYICEKLLIH